MTGQATAGLETLCSLSSKRRSRSIWVLANHCDVVGLSNQREPESLKGFDDLFLGGIDRELRHQVVTPASAMKTS